MFEKSKKLLYTFFMNLLIIFINIKPSANLFPYFVKVLWKLKMFLSLLNGFKGGGQLYCFILTPIFGCLFEKVKIMTLRFLQHPWPMWALYDRPTFWTMLTYAPENFTVGFILSCR